MFKNLLINAIQTKTCNRFYGKHNKKYYYKNGQKFDKVIYYPRTQDHQDPDNVEPSKLFKVQRTKPLKGNPYWENYVLQMLGLTKKMSDVVVVKNIPEVNAMLWKVKHLIVIKPVLFPFGEPTENDLNHTFLKENGECIVTTEIGVDESRLLAREEFDQKPERLDGETLRKDSRLKWLNSW